MPRPVALRLLTCCIIPAALFSSCKQTNFKLPKLKFQNKKNAPAEDAAASGLSAGETAFLVKCQELGNQGTTIAGRDGYFFTGSELYRIAQLKDPAAPSIAAAVTAVQDYHSQLKAKGIELVLVPVPPKAVIFPDKLVKDLKVKLKGKKPPRMDSSLQAAYASLRSRGVRVVDPTDELLANRESKKAGSIFPKTGITWAPRAAELTAALIESELGKPKWANQPGPEGPLITEAGTLTYSGPLATGAAAVAENLSIRNIGRSADGKMRSVTFSQSGHALALIGDPVLLAWREANNPAGSSGAFASLADQLAYEFQTTPDLFPGKGEGRNSSRQRILRDATNGRNPLGSAKTLIWVVQATDFALSDWKRVPLRLDLNLSAPPLMLDAPVNLIPDSSASPPSPRPASATPENAQPLSNEPGDPPLPR